jgi:hypothetical protein
MVEYKKFDQVVLWGHKLHSHTHSYIHGAFVKAFEYLGYKTLWLDKTDDISGINFENNLFITEGQVDEGIPIEPSSYYVIHNCNGEKYKPIPQNSKMVLQTYTYDADQRWKGTPIPNKTFEFYQGDGVWIPWATDLLPHEIDSNIELIKNNSINIKNETHFIGMPIEPWDKFAKTVQLKGIEYKRGGGFGNNISYEDNIKLIQSSIIAPALQCEWQVKHGYIPCRIFKNISYGKMGATNSPAVQKLFGDRLIYDSYIENLVDRLLEFELNSENIPKKIELMEYVRDNHTYLNRIDTIMWFFSK